jgi:hypothetical protein
MKVRVYPHRQNCVNTLTQTTIKRILRCLESDVSSQYLEASKQRHI